MGYRTRHKLKKLFKKLKGIIMTTQAEHAAQLQTLADQAEKARAEISGKIGTLTTQVDELQAALAAANNVNSDVLTAFERVKNTVQVLDDLNPDPTTNPEPNPTDPVPGENGGSTIV